MGGTEELDTKSAILSKSGEELVRQGGTAEAMYVEQTLRV